jgi:hypothetical protein
MPLKLRGPTHQRRRLHKLLREDYKAMREMFVDEPPSFDEIIGRLRVVETKYQCDGEGVLTPPPDF